MKLSLLIPTHRSAATIERTLGAAIRQTHRPLEICVYDEASDDGTREIVERLLGEAAERGIEVDFHCRDENSGPVYAWRVPLHRATGDWCCFVWADDVPRDDFSERMMAAADRAAAAGRKLVFCSALVEAGGRQATKYSADGGVLTQVEFSLGVFLRRYSLNQVNGIYETSAAREVFERHIRFDNPQGYDYNRFPYGNDVGFLSELSAAGEGVEVLPERLVTLVLSGGSMTRRALASHRWQLRWQYTYGSYRVWRWWQEAGVAGADRLVEMAGRRLALCELFLPPGRRRRSPARLARAVAAYRDYLSWDFERRPIGLDAYRRRVAELSR
jgi:glycosyltransferase involved in cell wall biosynthesis